MVLLKDVVEKKNAFGWTYHDQWIKKEVWGHVRDATTIMLRVCVWIYIMVKRLELNPVRILVVYLRISNKGCDLEEVRRQRNVNLY